MFRQLSLLLTFLILGSASQSMAQKYQLLTDPKKNHQMIVGECKRSVLQTDTFAVWFNKEYDSYKADLKTLDQLKPLMKNVRVTVVMATWCSDSRLQVPRFFKITDYLKYKSRKIRLICVDREKKTPDININDFAITLVPTFIFYRNGIEIGRIIESPVVSLETDLLKLLAASPGNK